MEGLRRTFFIYETREFVMRYIMSWANFRGLQGDYMEFGVFEGKSFVQAFHFARFQRLSRMHFYAFDSFTGYPPLYDIDKQGGYLKEGDYKCDQKTFIGNIKRGGVDSKRVTVMPGWFADLKKNAQGKIKEDTLASVVWFDCDLYISTLQALEFVEDYIAPGTIIVFADWFLENGSSDSGQPRAVREWLERNPNILLNEFANYFGKKIFIVSKPA